MSRTVLAPTAGLLVLLLLLLAPPAQAKKNKITRETLQSGGEERSYVLFVPDDLEPGVQVPLLLVLHGSRRDGKSIASKWDRLAKKEGFIVAGPESHNSDFWAAPEDGPEFLLDVVEAIQAEHPVDPSRVYLFGHSAGGHFVIQIGLWDYDLAGLINERAWEFLERYRLETEP